MGDAPAMTPDAGSSKRRVRRGVERTDQTPRVRSIPGAGSAAIAAGPVSRGLLCNMSGRARGKPIRPPRILAMTRHRAHRPKALSLIAPRSPCRLGTGPGCGCDAADRGSGGVYR
jgi:hypothetical protein